MDVAILPPQDFLKKHYNHHPNHHSRRFISSNKPHKSNNRRRRNSNSPPPQPSSSVQTHKPQPRRSPSPEAAQPVMCQVRILKRGEEIKPEKQAPLMMGPVGPIRGPVGPMRDAFGFYAGSACVTSPPPSDLPVPEFFRKAAAADNNQRIASDLRRALKIC